MNDRKSYLRQKYPYAWRWISLATHVYGWLTDAEAGALLDLARTATPDRGAVIVELGSWQGKSSLLLAAGVLGKSGARIFCVDPFSEDESHAYQAKYYAHLIGRRTLEDNFRRNMRRCGVGHIVHPIKGYSHDVVLSWKEPIDLLFIDASHEYESVYRDFADWSPFVKVGGTIAFHDVAPDTWPGPARVVAEELRPPQYDGPRQVDSLAWSVKQPRFHHRGVGRASSLGNGVLAEGSLAQEDGPNHSEGSPGQQLTDGSLDALIDALDRSAAQLALSRTANERLTKELATRAETAGHLAAELSAIEKQAAVLRADVRRLTAASARFEAEAAFGRAQVQRLQAQLRESLHALHALRQSWSWRVTAAPRALLDLAFALERARSAGLVRSLRNMLLVRLQWLRYRDLVRASGLFDEKYYLAHNPDVAREGMNPLRHFFLFGAAEARNPHPLFDVSYYYSRNPDVANAGINPLVHYLVWGVREKRNPHPDFDTSFYLSSYPDVAESALNPVAHYLGPGAAQGLDPNPRFDTSEYLEHNPEVALKGLNPLLHYVETGDEAGPPQPPLSESDAAPLVATPPQSGALPPGMRLDPRTTELRAQLRAAYQESGRWPLNSDYNSIPLVSVIIPCCNYGYYLEDAVLTAMMASSYPLEIIVIDDGSTDKESVATVEDLVSRYQFRFISQEHAGQAAARYNGLRNSRGKFVQFLDADDLLAPGKIDFQVDLLLRDPEIDIAVCEYELCDADGGGRRMMEPSTLAGFAFTAEDFLLRWERGFSLPIHCALFRRGVLKDQHFPRVTRCGKEDWIFWIAVSSASPRFHFHPDVLASYRIHGHNTYTDREGMGLDFLRACMYVISVGLNTSESFLEASIAHFRDAYLGSIKHEAIVWSRTHGIE